MQFILSNDVENFSISLNKESPHVAKQIYRIGLPRLLGVLSKNDVKSTFYFTGTFCEESPESVELVIDHGHEVGCHGYDHSHKHAFDSMNLDEQIIELKKAKNIIEDIAGRIWDFRAPALRINEYTLKALEHTGFNTDSSIASQRFDGPFTFGSKKKLMWLVAPRFPYYPSYHSIVKRGKSKILEVPISALIFPYIGTTMRVSPTILKFVEKTLFFESTRTGKPIVFLFHPNECLDAISGVRSERRAGGSFEYLFADVIRHELKMTNLGIKAAILLNDVIKRAKKKGFEFMTMQEYSRKFKRNG